MQKQGNGIGGDYRKCVGFVSWGFFALAVIILTLVMCYYIQ